MSSSDDFNKLTWGELKRLHSTIADLDPADDGVSVFDFICAGFEEDHWAQVWPEMNEQVAV